MADVLIMDRDNRHPDPVKDAAGSYKRGMIVSAHPDGQLQTPPATTPFLLIRVPNVPVEFFSQYRQEEHIDTGVLDQRGNKVYRQTLRRLFKLDIDALPPNIANDLRNNREATIRNVGFLRSAMLNLRTSAYDDVPQEINVPEWQHRAE